MPKIAKLSFKHLGAAYLLITALTATPSFAQIKPGNLTQFTEQDGLPGIQVNSLLQDKFGYMWVGTINGLARYDGYEFKRFYNNPNDSTSINGLIVWSIYEDKEGRIWTGTSPENLNVYNPVTKTFRHFPFKHLVDHLANFEIGIVTMCEDLQDRIYFGVGSQYNTIKPGLLYYDKTEDQIKRFIAPDSLEIQNIYRVIAAKPGNVWILSTNGFFKISADRKLSRIRSLEKEIAKTKDGISDIKIGNDGLIWASTWQSKLYKIDPDNEKYNIYSSVKSGSGNNSELNYTAIALDKNDNIWIGTNKGLYYFDRKKEKFEVFKVESNKQLEQTTINALKFDSFGTLWIATSTKGLFKYEERALLKSYIYSATDKNSITPGWVNNIYEAKNGQIWITTSGQGLSSGINELDPQTGSIRSWPYKTTLPAAEYVSGIMEISPGEFYISINANDVNTNSTPPKVFLTDLKLFNKSVIPGEQSILKDAIYETTEITLAHDQNNISIEFMAIHYSNPSKNNCAFKLENYDNDWREVGNQHTASYPMLPPGEYEFRVKAANNNGVWNELGATLKIIISQPWWKTTWAYGLYLLIFALAVFAADRYFRNRVIQKERERNRTRELEQAREIQKAYTELKATQAQLIQSEKMASLGELTAGIAHEIQNPLNFVNNFSEVSNELIVEIEEERAKNQESRDEKLVSEILSDIKQNLEKINHHGKRADAIVKGMLQHSRTSTGQKELTDINALADEYLRLAYHGLRAKDKSFNADFKTDFDESIGKIDVIPQDIGRVILNLITNAFYAAPCPPKGGSKTRTTNMNRLYG